MNEHPYSILIILNLEKHWDEDVLVLSAFPLTRDLLLLLFDYHSTHLPTQENFISKHKSRYLQTFQRFKI